MIIISLFIILLLVVNASAVYTEEKSKISFGHALRIQNITVPELSPGEPGFLKVNLKNNAAYSITDVRSKLILPLQFQFFEDVSEVRIAEIRSSETKEIEYKIIALPSAVEGVYGSSLVVNYITHFGINAFNVGDENQDNYTLGIIIKNNPSIFMILDSTELYKGKDIGDITLKFVNNGTSNIKFLTVNFMESGDYEIISDNKNYIGDLDSDDFQSATYKIKIKSRKEIITIPIKVSYMDSMNNYYSKEFYTDIKMRGAQELGKSNGNYIPLIVLILVIIACIGYYFYRKNKRKRGRFKI